MKSSSVHYLRGRREGQLQRNALFKPGFFLLGTKRLEKMEQQIHDNVHGNPNLNIRTGTTNGVSKKCTEHTKSSWFKGTMSWDFLLQVFSWIIFPPKLPKITIGSFRIFSKIRGDIRKWMCTTGIIDTGGAPCAENFRKNSKQP